MRRARSCGIWGAAIDLCLGCFALGSFESLDHVLHRLLHEDRRLSARESDLRQPLLAFAYSMPSRRVDRSLAAGRIGENDDCHIILHPKDWELIIVAWKNQRTVAYSPSAAYGRGIAPE